MTQRTILSFVSSVFDPLGLLAPFTMRMRILLKSIWIQYGQRWDESVSNEERACFLAWATELTSMRQVKLNRHYFMSLPGHMELHIFSDASLEAMAIVAYIRYQQKTGSEVSFILEKSRIAPMKQLSVPRLELQAAMYGVRLRKLICSEHDLKFESIYHWTDSETVLQWLKNAHQKQVVFVSNRVSEILEGTTIDEWRLVRGELNPADIGTRGISLENLTKSEWLTGPAWLKLPIEEWPVISLGLDEVTPSMGEMESIFVTQKRDLITWDRFSSFSKIQRVIAFCLRFRSKTNTSYISVDELKNSRKVLIKLVQRELFPETFANLQKGAEGRTDGNLKKFTLFLDDFGSITAQGRLKDAKNLSFDQRHPILLCSTHPVVKLLLLQAHIDNLHEGVEYVRNVIQQEFCVLGLRNALRKIKGSCVDCRKFRSAVKQPFMADLPPERLDFQAHPFTNTGIDYFRSL